MKFRLVAAVALISTVSLVAAACGGDDDDGYGGSSATNPPATSTTAPATSPAGGATTSGGGAQTNAAVVKVGNSVKFGSILTSPDGMTLYTFIQDVPGKSNCNGSCAATWPPVTTTATSAPTVDGAPGKFSLVNRDDGTKQVAYNGAPLYRYAPDKAPGDTNGQGVGNVWFVATASAAATPAATSATPAAGADNPYGY